MSVEVTGGASTTSRRPERMLTGLSSIRTKENRVMLEDGRWYTDWEMGLAGPIFSYNPKWWRDEIIGCLHLGGSIASIAHKYEFCVAEQLALLYPGVEAVRWMCNGSDACAAAAKLARAVTGRDKILSYGYHGTASAYCAPPEMNARTGLKDVDMRRGTLAAEREAFGVLEWLDGDACNKIRGLDVAAIIIECPPTRYGQRTATRWLKECAERAKHCGVLFILDEVVTGFRYGPNGAAGYYGLEGLVDLYCFGKTIGNGFPIAALAGRKEIMDELTNGVHFSGTFFGYPLGLAAAKATLRQFLDEPPWDHLYDIGRYLEEKWNEAVPYKLIGHPTRPIINPDTVDERFTDLRRHLFRRGHIACDHPWYVSTATVKADIDDLVSAAKEFMDG